MKKLSLAVLAVFVALLLAGVPTRAQDNSAKSNAQAAGQESKSAAKNAGKAAEKGTEKGVDKVTGKIDINSASSEQLQKLSGIGPATADKIIAGRPYRTKRDLLSKKIVSQKEYDAISDKIVAHKATAKP
jgi:competence protein ComEA